MIDDGLVAMLPLLPSWCPTLGDASVPDNGATGCDVVTSMGPAEVDEVVNLLLLQLVRRCWTLLTPLLVKATDTSAPQPLQYNKQNQ
jgi:hypothetical protein